jgi:hypothetical protein
MDSIHDTEAFPGLGSGASREKSNAKTKLDKDTKASVVWLGNVKPETTDFDIANFLRDLDFISISRTTKSKNPTYPIIVHMMLVSAA